MLSPLLDYRMYYNYLYHSLDWCSNLSWAYQSFPGRVILNFVQSRVVNYFEFLCFHMKIIDLSLNYVLFMGIMMDFSNFKVLCLARITEKHLVTRDNIIEKEKHKKDSNTD